MAGKLIVFSFGRFNPPTVGHEKLANTVKMAAERLGATPRIYLSHTQDKKKNPLPYDLKLKYAQAAFGPMVTASDANTIIKVLAELNTEFTDIVFIAGSDRVVEFEKLFNDYNGKGDYEFRTIRVISAGERDPDSDGVEGMSASKMRELANAGDLEGFISGLPDKLKPAAATMMKAVRLGMGLTEDLNERKRKKSKKTRGFGGYYYPGYGYYSGGNSGEGDADSGESMAEGKVKLYTDPDYYGADVSDDAGAGLPVKQIPLKNLVGFEPDDKMKGTKNAANMRKMVNLIKSGKGNELPAILVRKYKSGYQVLDGHHRFHAYKAAGATTIPGKIVPEADIEEISKNKVNEELEEGEGFEQEAGIGIDGKSFKFKIKDLVALADKYPVVKIDPKQFADQIAGREEDEAQSMARAQKADLQYPIIVVKRQNGQLWIADGTHRAHKSILNKLPSINAKVIPIADMSQFAVKESVAEGQGQQISVQQLATISDEALDNAYHYGRSTPGNTFGWQANLKSAAYAKQMIDRGVTDIEAISDAIHKGWNVTAKAFVNNPEQFDDTEKLKAAGKLEAKLQQRAKLMNIGYAQLPDDEQEKDRVVARALLQAINGPQGVAEGSAGYKNTPLQDYNGLQFMIDSNHPYLRVKAFAPGSGQQLAQVDFKIDDQDELHPEDLHVEERWRGQGIAKVMYDYVKSQGYTIHRSWSQTDAGSAFWNKHQGQKRVWEQGMMEAIKPTGVKAADGEFYVSDHFMSRVASRNLTGKKIAQMIYDVIRQHGDKLRVMGPNAFVIRSKEGIGIGVVKVQQPDDSYKYILRTVHPTLKASMAQDIIMVESDDLNIKINHDLNPAIFANGKMRAEVRVKLLKIADDFKQSLGIDLPGLIDITVSGSNAAFNYTSKSDIDLHLVVDVPKLDQDELYRELFDAKKFKYNAEHDYKIRGYDVELYVQDSRQKHVSQGIYSINRDEWIKEPKPVSTAIDKSAVHAKYELIKNLIERAVKTSSFQLASKLRNIIKKYRQAGLEAHGEFGAENLAFKALRANGYMGRLYDLLNNLQDQELSLENQEVLDEVSMTPGALMDFAKSPVAQSMKIGFEAEMIVGDMDYSEDDGGESEIDYEMDELVTTSNMRAMSDDLYAFFRDTTSRREVDQAVDVINDDLNEYMEEQFSEEVANDQETLAEKVRAQLPDDASSDEDVQKSIEEEDSAYGTALEEWRDEFYSSWDDLEGFLDANDLERMIGWHERFGWDWPHYTEGGGDNELSEESVEAVAETISEWLGGVKIKSSTGYHSVTRSPDTWILETDSSINNNESDGEAGLELVSPPMLLNDGLEKLDQFLYWASEHRVKTDRSTGFHMGVSLPDQTFGSIDHLKLVLFLGDEHVLRVFGRSSNSYAQSSLKLMREKIASNDLNSLNSEIPSIMAQVKQGLDQAVLKSLGDKIVPMDKKYVTVNIKRGYVEFRSAGGNWIRQQDAIRTTLLRYVRVMAIAADPQAEKREYAKKLYKLLATNNDPDIQDVVMLFSVFSSGVADKGWLISNLKRIRSARKPKDQGNKDPAISTQAPQSATQQEPQGRWERWIVYGINDEGDPAPMTAISARDRQEATRIAFRWGRDNNRVITGLNPENTPATSTQASQSGWQQDFEILDGDRVVHRFSSPAQGSAYEYAVRWARENDLYQTGRWTWRSASRQTESVDVLDSEDKRLYEISMTPGALADFSKTPAAKAMTIGFEAEIIVPGLINDEDDLTNDHGMDAILDESYEDWNAFAKIIRRFFWVSGGPTSIEIDRVLETANRHFNNYVEKLWYDHSLDAVEEWITEKYGEDYWAQMEMFIDRSDDDQFVVLGDTKFDNSWQEFKARFRKAEYANWFEDKLNDDIVGRWLGFRGLTTMMDFGDAYSLDFPYKINSNSMTPEELGADWVKYTGYKATVSDGYHRGKRPAGVWTFEPDSSIDPEDLGDHGGIELISPPMPFEQGIEALDKFFRWAKQNRIKANESTGFHMGVSIPNQDLLNVDHLKLILFLGDEYVLKQFGRQANTYTRSSMLKLQQTIKLGYDRNLRTTINPATAFDLMRKGLDNQAAQALNMVVQTGSDRYVSVNIKSNYIEFRSAGGDYFQNINLVKNTLLRYVRAMAIAADPNAEKREYAKKLYKLFSIEPNNKNTNSIKLFSMYASGQIGKLELKQALMAKAIIKKTPPLTNDIPVPVGSIKYFLYDISTNQVLQRFTANNDQAASNYRQAVRDAINEPNLRVRRDLDESRDLSKKPTLSERIDMLRERLKVIKGRYALVSKKDPKKVLQYYHGPKGERPSEEWVNKVERRIHAFEGYKPTKYILENFTDQQITLMLGGHTVDI